MAKITYKVTCDSVSSNAQTSIARFFIEGAALPAAAAGQPPSRSAKTIFTAVFTDSAEAIKFKAGVNYTISIE